MSTLQTFTASVAKNNFGKVLAAAQRAPVAIERHGKKSAYVVTGDDMEAFEDFYLGMRAQEILAQGESAFIGIKETERMLDAVRHA